MKKRFALFIATAGGFGYSPVASGTAGTAIALPFAYIIMHASIPVQLAVPVACYPLFTWAASEGEKIFGKSDAGEIVCDEVLGLWLTLFALPPDSMHLALGFLLFRFFDIIKPPPARAIDKKMHGGHGVMLDDLVAGLYAHICLRLLIFV